MRKALRILAVALSLTLVVSVAQAAVKAGSVCSKLGSTSTVSGKKYTCIKSGKKLVWNKGVKVAAPMPTNSQTSASAPTLKSLIAGDPCKNIGDSANNAQGYLECREVANKELKYFQLSTSFSAILNPASPDSLATCQIKDQRPVTNAYNWQAYRAIAYPAQSERGFTNSGEEKIVVVGIDFIDAVGTGTPKAALDEIIKNSTE